MGKSMDDYLNEGMYGPRQTNPDERRKFLGTVRERVILALTKGQVLKGLGLLQLEQLMKEHKEAKLILNGIIDGQYFSPYRKLASKFSISYTIVTNQDADTEFGLIFAYPNKAIDKENIFLVVESSTNKDESKKEEKGVTSFFKKLFSNSNK